MKKGSATEFTGGLPETYCGRGSTIARTEAVREKLPYVIMTYGIKSLLDAPCGDGNWMSTLEMDVKYYGIDVRAQNIAVAREREWKIKDRTFVVGDVIRRPWPQVDAILCRDFLQHIKIESIKAYLDRVKRSGAKYLIATCHVKKKNKEIGPKMVRSVNIETKPYFFGSPIMSIEEIPGKINLSVYKLRSA